jgi:hypothetical protein
MSGVSFATAASMWGRFEPHETMDGIAVAACNHGLAEGYLSLGEAESFLEGRNR